MQRHVVCQRSRAGQGTGTEVTGSEGSLALGSVTGTAMHEAHSRIAVLFHPSAPYLLCRISQGAPGSWHSRFQVTRARRFIQKKRSMHVRFSTFSKIGYDVIDSCPTVRAPDWRADGASHRLPGTGRLTIHTFLNNKSILQGQFGVRSAWPLLEPSKPAAVSETPE